MVVKRVDGQQIELLFSVREWFSSSTGTEVSLISMGQFFS